MRAERQRREDGAGLPRPTADAVLRRAGTGLARFLRRLCELLTSRNARMAGESACRLCGVCHHLCGLIAAPGRSGGSPKE